MKLADVEAFAIALPDVVVGARWGNKTWLVGDRGFLWLRPLSKADIGKLGDATPPSGDIVALRTENLDAKEAMLAMDLPGFFTIDHFRNYPALLVELRRARVRDVKAAIREAHRCVADQPPKRARPRASSRTRSR